MGRCAPDGSAPFVQDLNTDEVQLSTWDCRSRFGNAQKARACYFVTTPQAMRSPEFPEGSVFMSSALAWTTSAVPPLLKSEWLSFPKFTSLSSNLKFALPFA